MPVAGYLYSVSAVSLEFFPARDLAPVAGGLFTAVEAERGIRN